MIYISWASQGPVHRHAGYPGRGLALLITESRGVILPNELLRFGSGDTFGIPYPIVVFAVVAIAAAVLGGASLFGGVGSVLPVTVLGAILIQMVQSGLVFTRVDIYVQPLVQAAIIFLAILLDSLRNSTLRQLGRRTIRVET